jgi:hypothetical protein
MKRLWITLSWFESMRGRDQVLELIADKQLVEEFLLKNCYLVVLKVYSSCRTGRCGQAGHLIFDRSRGLNVDLKANATLPCRVQASA